MIASMTGFGRALLDAPLGRIIVEIQSVNRKYLEMFISLPKEYSRFELEIRKWIGEKISRGQISVRVYVIPAFKNIRASLPSFEQLKLLKEGWEELADRLGYTKTAIDLPFLTQQMPLQMPAEAAQDEDLEFFKHCMLEALQALITMKRFEGKALCCDIELRLQSMQQHVAQIELSVPETVSRMKKKLQERIAEAAPALLDNDEKVLREITLFAEKVDISEEITRFRSHLAQFHELLKAPAAIGRKMDFLVQEIGREINTMGSKSLESKIAHLVVEVKSELEKIREQIQNIE
jgi:uncharacterized protein (TIGR00255 family)